MASGFLIAVLTSALLAPLLDHHALERLPWHRHLVLADHTREGAEALAKHVHQYERVHTHSAAFGKAVVQEAVVAIGGAADALGGGFSPAIWQGVSLDSSAPPAIDSRASLLSSALFILAGTTVRIPKPPPRSFSEFSSS